MESKFKTWWKSQHFERSPWYWHENSFIQDEMEKVWNASQGTLKEENKALIAAIRLMTGQAGNPNAIEGCHNIIQTGKEALKRAGYYR